MADPFSIIAGTAGLIDVLWRCGVYVKHIRDLADTINEDIDAVSHELDALISVNKSIQATFTAELAKVPSSLSADAKLVENTWQNVGGLLRNCHTTAKQLKDWLQDIVGEEGSSTRVAGITAIKKALKKDNRTHEFKELRQKLTNYQSCLQVLLTALNLSYTRSSQDSTDVLGAINCAKAVASQASPNRHFDIPQSVSSVFTGRTSLLEDLQKAFDVSEASKESDAVQKRFIIYGLGGSGKTQFCCKFAQVNRNNFWGVFCIDASSPQTAEASFSKVAKIGGFEPSEGSNQRAAKQWFAGLESRWLLIIDNADDPSLALEDYFPSGERGCVLVTTRIPANRIHGTVGSCSYCFEELTPDEANDLLLKTAGKPHPWEISTRKAGARIAQALGYLPLALVQAGAAIVRGLCSLANYVDYYRKCWQRIRQARLKSGYRGDEQENMNVYSSYEVNLQNLEDSSDPNSIDAMQLLKMFSCFHSENIRLDVLIAAAKNPCEERRQQKKNMEEQNRLKAVTRTKTVSEALTEGMRSVLEFALRDRSPPILPAILREAGPRSASHEFLEPRLRRALTILSQMSLINHHETTDNYSMHPLVHEWVRERPEMRVAEQALWCQAAKTTISQCILLPPHGSSEQEEAMRRSLLPHVNHVRKCQTVIDTKIRDNQKARWLFGLPVPKAQFGRQQAIELAKFSRVYFECGLWEEAEDLQLAVKEFVCKRLGAQHPVTVDVMLLLSWTYWNQARTNEAAELQYQAYQACISSLGPNHPKTHKVMDHLGSSRCFQGRFKEALELHEKTIKGMKSTPPSNQEDLFIAMRNLGRVKWRYFQYEEAKEIHTKAMEGIAKLLGPTHPQTLGAMEDLALSYLDCGQDRLDDARDLMLKVLDQRQLTLGKEHPLSLLATSNLARVESARDNTIEAERLFRRAIPIAERSLGENHFGTLAGKVHFANVLVRQKRYDEAEEIFTKVVERQRYKSAARENGDHPDRIFAMWHLVRCYELHGKVDDALLVTAQLEQVVNTIGGQGLGKLHPFAKQLTEKLLSLFLRHDAASNSFSMLWSKVGRVSALH
ncbi:tetratricopeptide repeat domain-containing protein [Rhizodiscina lignyota]|uniref:Tetratricopeptide repeat domain-containing protein n=1 Tax=Rhizodiscina lignyota TaxID=1504668 RepID=A0A9P4IBV5_9PEZI|nr:tetratricopeptide repeat domain-containing protein [Rhizodiscina lignyota]